MNIYHLTKDEIKKLEAQAKELKKELSYWNKTDVKTEYIRDLNELGV